VTASAIQRAWWSDSIATLLASSPLPIIGALTQASGFDVSHPQVLAWKAEIALLQQGSGFWHLYPHLQRIS
jgi:hypothetical protein